MPFQEAVPRGILFVAARNIVGRAIDFDGDAGGEPGEIDNVRTDGYLAAEVRTEPSKRTEVFLHCLFAKGP